MNASIRMDFQTKPCVELDTLRAAIERNIRHASAVGHNIVRHPFALKGFAAVVPIAVVGGGPSVARYAEWLRKWQGPVWAINGAWAWCHDNGIANATLYSVDPHPCLAEIIKGRTVKRAILGMAVDWSVIEAIEAQTEKCDLAIYDSGWHGFETGPTSATAACILAPLVGYSVVNFYGCEGSYLPNEGHHIYEGETDAKWMQVSVAGGVYTTKPEWMIQAACLASIIRALPTHYRAHGGGLLDALVREPDWSISAVSKEFYETLEVPEGCGLVVKDRP